MRRLIEFWERQSRLDKPAEKLSEIVRQVSTRSPGGKHIADFLHGKWLGHPLHPVLTDVPVGAWSAAAMFDVASLGKKRPSPPATAAIALGVVASLPTALAGLMDWHHLYGGPKRIGMGHALLNSMALMCYVASLASRRKGGLGRSTAFAGLGFMTASAYLGGDMVYRGKAGVDHSPSASPPSNPTIAGSLEDLSEHQAKRFEIEGYPVLLYRSGARVYAIGDTCPHMGCSLSEGSVDAEQVVCPCHGSTFSLVDGHVISGPSPFPVPALQARIIGGQVQVEGGDHAS